MAYAVLKPPAQVLLEAQIRAYLIAAGFKSHNSMIEPFIVGAILRVRDYKANPIPIAAQPTPNGQAMRGAKNKDALRMYLYSILFTAWVWEFEVKPRINNKKGKSTPFTNFAAPILKREKFGKFIDHAEKYQSYRAEAIEVSEKANLDELSGGV